MEETHRQELERHQEQVAQLTQKRQQQQQQQRATPPSLRGTHAEPRKLSSESAAQRRNYASLDKTNPSMHDLYVHVMQLDSQLAEKERAVSQLTAEKAELERRNKDLDTAYRKVATELQKEQLRRDDVIDTTRASLIEQVRQLEKREQKLLRELRSIRTTERAKSSSLDSLEKKLATLDALTIRVRDLESDLRSRDAVITKLRAHGRALKTELERKNSELQRVDDSSHGIPYHLWRPEREKLLVCVVVVVAESFLAKQGAYSSSGSVAFVRVRGRPKSRS